MSTLLLHDRATHNAATPDFLVQRHHWVPFDRPAGVSTHYVLGVLRSGHGRFEALDGPSRGKIISKRAGSVTLSPAGPVARLRCHDHATVTVCAFSPSFMQEIASDLNRALPEPNGSTTVRDNSIVRLAALFEEEAASGNPAGILYLESLARALALRFFLLAQPLPVKLLGALPPLRLNRVLDAMQAGIANPPNLQTLAGASGYSPHHFTRLFRAATGSTPHDYMLQLRVARAQELLQRGSDSITEIAYSTGFSSQAHFTTIFRRFTGATPGAWRRDMRQNPRISGRSTTISPLILGA